jgi:hypothetical protein
MAKRQVLPDEYLIKPELLEIFKQHKTISTYINNFSQNVKSGIRKMLHRLNHEVLRLIPGDVVEKLNIEICHPALKLTFADNVESFIDQAPNFRKIQMENENRPE